MIDPAMPCGSAEAGLVTGWPGRYPWAAPVAVSALVCWAQSGPATPNSKTAANSRIRPPDERRDLLPCWDAVKAYSRAAPSSPVTIDSFALWPGISMLAGSYCGRALWTFHGDKGAGARSYAPDPVDADWSRLRSICRE